MLCLFTPSLWDYRLINGPTCCCYCMGTKPLLVIATTNHNYPPSLANSQTRPCPSQATVAFNKFGSTMYRGPYDMMERLLEVSE